MLLNTVCAICYEPLSRFDYDTQSNRGHAPTNMCFKCDKFIWQSIDLDNDDLI